MLCEQADGSYKVSDEDKASILFTLIAWNDEEGGATISTEQMERFLADTQKLVDESGTFIANCISTMDGDENGIVTHKELRASVFANPDTFLMLLGV